MKYFKNITSVLLLSVKYSSVCMCITNTNTMKKRLNNKSVR